MKWLPDRKVYAGGIGGVLTWIVVTVALYYGLDIPLELQQTVPLLVGFAISYLVPPSQQDIVKRVNDKIVALAAADVNNPTTALVPGKPIPTAVRLLPELQGPLETLKRDLQAHSQAQSQAVPATRLPIIDRGLVI